MQIVQGYRFFWGKWIVKKRGIICGEVPGIFLDIFWIFVHIRGCRMVATRSCSPETDFDHARPGNNGKTVMWYFTTTRNAELMSCDPRCTKSSTKGFSAIISFLTERIGVGHLAWKSPKCSLTYFGPSFSDSGIYNFNILYKWNGVQWQLWSTTTIRNDVVENWRTPYDRYHFGNEKVS